MKPTTNDIHPINPLCDNFGQQQNKPININNGINHNQMPFSLIFPSIFTVCNNVHLREDKCNLYWVSKSVLGEVLPVGFKYSILDRVCWPVYGHKIMRRKIGQLGFILQEEERIQKIFTKIGKNLRTAIPASTRRQNNVHLTSIKLK